MYKIMITFYQIPVCIVGAHISFLSTGQICKQPIYFGKVKSTYRSTITEEPQSCISKGIRYCLVTISLSKYNY